MPDTMPKLSEILEGPRRPDACQGCGARWVELSRWWECDEADRPTTTVVVACNRCLNRLVACHDRLYIALAQDEHHPGSMPICTDCRNRDGLRCPLSKLYGGPGVVIEPPGRQIHLQMARRKDSGWHTLWSPARACSGRTVLAISEEP